MSSTHFRSYRLYGGLKRIGIAAPAKPVIRADTPVTEPDQATDDAATLAFIDAAQQRETARRLNRKRF